MLSIEKEYNEKYGMVPEDSDERYQYMIQKIKSPTFKERLDTFIHEIKQRETNTISFTIYLLPKATPRPRLGKGGLFYVKGASDNKKFFRNFLQDTEYPLITTPVIFSCNAYFPIPSSMTQIEKMAAELGLIRPISKPDWDNVAKTYCDMIQDTLLYDDSLIIEGTSKKYYSLKPRVEISLTYFTTHDSAFNEKKMQQKLGK